MSGRASSGRCADLLSRAMSKSSRHVDMGRTQVLSVGWVPRTHSCPHLVFPPALLCSLPSPDCEAEALTGAFLMSACSVSDVWQLGIILAFRMLTFPFNTEHRAQPSLGLRSPS